MPNIIREDKATLESTLTVSILKEDYEDAYKQELKKIAKTKTFKGFRTGKTPVSFVRKMYGNSVLNSVIQTKLESEIESYMKEGNFIASPIPVEGEQPTDINISNPQDQYDFVFHLGHKPEISVDLETMLADVKKPVLDQLPAEEVDKIMEDILTSRESFKLVEGEAAQEKDKVTFELAENAEYGALSSASLLLTNQVTDTFKELVVGKMPNDTFECNINEVLADSTPEKIAEQLFSEELEEVEYTDMFTFKILAVDRLSRPELNDEFVASLEEVEINTVEDLRSRLEENKKFEVESFFRDKTIGKIFDTLYNSLDFDLPEAYLERYMALNNQGEPIEDLEKAYKSWRWELFVEKTALDNEIQVSKDEIMRSELQRFKSMGFGNMPGIDGMIMDMLEKQFKEKPASFNEVYERIYISKVLNAVHDNTNLLEEKVSFEDYKRSVEEEEAKRKAQNEKAAEEE